MARGPEVPDEKHFTRLDEKFNSQRVAHPAIFRSAYGGQVRLRNVVHRYKHSVFIGNERFVDVSYAVTLPWRNRDAQ